jgi:hypothetical protein
VFSQPFAPLVLQGRAARVVVVAADPVLRGAEPSGYLRVRGAFEEHPMDVQEVRGVHPFEFCSSFDRELHGVDVRENLGSSRADPAAGLLVGLGTSKAAGIYLHALDLRGSDRLGSQQESREWHQLGPRTATLSLDSVVRKG